MGVLFKCFRNDKVSMRAHLILQHLHYPHPTLPPLTRCLNRTDVFATHSRRPSLLSGESTDPNRVRPARMHMYAQRLILNQNWVELNGLSLIHGLLWANEAHFPDQRLRKYLTADLDLFSMKLIFTKKETLLIFFPVWSPPSTLKQRVLPPHQSLVLCA